jgi:23S rRNA U2552 (ribose-2'-O)-methylase RlmE/FtsJ
MADLPSTQISSLIQGLETRLNQAKDSLNRPDFASLKRKDPGEQQMRQARAYVTKEKGAQNASRAWFKLMEMLLKTPLGAYLLTLPMINAFFNAELPGAFIFAFNHFAHQYHKTLRWVIASYLPKSEKGKDFLSDQYGLMAKYPGNSLVGQIKTNRGVFWSEGDLTHPKTPAILAQLAKSKLGQINLYTADGGFDVEGRENLQEVLSLPLIRGEVEAGVLSLSNGGCLVLKIFTFFTPQMRTLLGLLMRLFQQLDIFKPETSGRLNSESYVIGLGFKGISPEQLNQLRQDPLNPQTRYVTLTPSEEQFILGRMRTLVEYQITQINAFLDGQPVSMNLDWLQQLSVLQPDDRL